MDSVFADDFKTTIDRFGYEILPSNSKYVDNTSHFEAKVNSNSTVECAKEQSQVTSTVKINTEVEILSDSMLPNYSDEANLKQALKTQVTIKKVNGNISNKVDCNYKTKCSVQNDLFKSGKFFEVKLKSVNDGSDNISEHEKVDHNAKFVDSNVNKLLTNGRVFELCGKRGHRNSEHWFCHQLQFSDRHVENFQNKEIQEITMDVVEGTEVANSQKDIPNTKCAADVVKETCCFARPESCFKDRNRKGKYIDSDISCIVGQHVDTDNKRCYITGKSKKVGDDRDFTARYKDILKGKYVRVKVEDYLKNISDKPTTVDVFETGLVPTEAEVSYISEKDGHTGTTRDLATVSTCASVKKSIFADVLETTTGQFENKILLSNPKYVEDNTSHSEAKINSSSIVKYAKEQSQATSVVKINTEAEILSDSMLPTCSNGTNLEQALKTRVAIEEISSTVCNKVDCKYKTKFGIQNDLFKSGKYFEVKLKSTGDGSDISEHEEVNNNAKLVDSNVNKLLTNGKVFELCGKRGHRHSEHWFCHQLQFSDRHIENFPNKEIEERTMDIVEGTEVANSDKDVPYTEDKSDVLKETCRFWRSQCCSKDRKKNEKYKSKDCNTSCTVDQTVDTNNKRNYITDKSKKVGDDRDLIARHKDILKGKYVTVEVEDYIKNISDKVRTVHKDIDVEKRNKSLLKEKYVRVNLIDVCKGITHRQPTTEMCRNYAGKLNGKLKGRCVEVNLDDVLGRCTDTFEHTGKQKNVEHKNSDISKCVTVRLDDSLKSINNHENVIDASCHLDAECKQIKVDAGSGHHLTEENVYLKRRKSTNESLSKHNVFQKITDKYKCTQNNRDAAGKMNNMLECRDVSVKLEDVLKSRWKKEYIYEKSYPSHSDHNHTKHNVSVRVPGPNMCISSRHPGGKNSKDDCADETDGLPHTRRANRTRRKTTKALELEELAQTKRYRQELIQYKKEHPNAFSEALLYPKPKRRKAHITKRRHMQGTFYKKNEKQSKKKKELLMKNRNKKARVKQCLLSRRLMQRNRQYDYVTTQEPFPVLLIKDPTNSSVLEGYSTGPGTGVNVDPGLAANTFRVVKNEEDSVAQPLGVVEENELFKVIKTEPVSPGESVFPMDINQEYAELKTESVSPANGVPYFPVSTPLSVFDSEPDLIGYSSLDDDYLPGTLGANLRVHSRPGVHRNQFCTEWRETETYSVEKFASEQPSSLSDLMKKSHSDYSTTKQVEDEEIDVVTVTDNCHKRKSQKRNYKSKSLKRNHQGKMSNSKKRNSNHPITFLIRHPTVAYMEIFHNYCRKVQDRSEGFLFVDHNVEAGQDGNQDEDQDVDQDEDQDEFRPKDVHKFLLDRKRRREMRLMFKNLRDCIPSLQGKGEMPKNCILKCAVDTIKELKDTCDSLQVKKRHLLAENTALSEKYFSYSSKKHDSERCMNEPVSTKQNL